jgi:spermidine/putrescine transport system substrate-binding protein
MSRSRRSYLKATGTAALAATALAGCTGDGETSGNGNGNGNGNGGSSSDGEDDSGGTTGSSGDDLADTLNIFAWGTYLKDPWVNGFEEEYGVTINTETYSSNADAINKLRVVEEGTYDLFMPTNYAVERAMAMDLVEPVGVDNIPVYEDQFDALKLDAFNQDGGTYAVPADFGITGMMYRPDAVDEDIGDTASLDMLWDDAYEGRLCNRDNAKLEIFYAALKDGQDPNDPSDLDSVQETLSEHVPLLRTFWTSSADTIQIMESGDVDVMTAWDGPYRRLKEDGVNVSYATFEEGTKGWLDTFAIPKGAKHKTTAQKYINYCMGEQARTWLDETGYATASKRADYSDDELKRYNLTESALNSFTFQGYVPDERQQEYDSIWTEVKTSS